MAFVPRVTRIYDLGLNSYLRVTVETKLFTSRVLYFAVVVEF